MPEVLAPIRFDNDRGLERRRIFPFPEEEFLSIALETNLDEHDATEWVGLNGCGTWDVGGPY